MRIVQSALILLAASLLGCDQPSEKTKPKSASPAQTPMDFVNRVAKTEVQEKIRLKDYMVYSTMGYAEHFPGIDSQIGNYVRGTFSSKDIEDTSDVIRDDDAHKRFVEGATQYASKFNQEMVSGMRVRGLLPEPIQIRSTPMGFAFDGESFQDAILVTEAIQAKTEGRYFAPIIVSCSDMKSDEGSQIFSALTIAGYRNILFEKIEEAEPQR